MRLVVPLPAWSDIDDFAGLKPWVADHRFGMVERIDVLPIHFRRRLMPISDETGRALRDKLCGFRFTPIFQHRERRHCRRPGIQVRMIDVIDAVRERDWKSATAVS